MNRYIIKNNIKLMCRSWVNILLFVIMPVILVVCLSSAFDSLMKKYDDAEITAGYRVEGDGVTDEMIEKIYKKMKEHLSLKFCRKVVFFEALITYYIIIHFYYYYIESLY